ncbi:MAG TPA: SDR family NAD(P)-dependent oxidoreductase, partial [Burkholderiaceae bacterium]
MDLDRLPLTHFFILDMNHSPETRVALITGGAKGIGAEVCARLASLGHHLLVADLDIDAAAATARELQAAGGR